MIRREGHLRGQQALGLYAANSLFVEGYLTTKGDATRDTYRMIEDAGFEIQGNPLWALDPALPDEDPRPKLEGGFQIPGGGNQLLKPEIVAK